MTAAFIKELQELKNSGYSSLSAARKSHKIVNEVLHSIFELNTDKTQFTEEDKQIIGSLLADAIRPIQINIETTRILHRTRLCTSVLRKRSSLQFLIDNYSSFPVGKLTLSSKLKEADFKETIEVLDNFIAEWRDKVDPEDPATDYEDAGGSDVPRSHTWWLH